MLSLVIDLPRRAPLVRVRPRVRRDAGALEIDHRLSVPPVLRRGETRVSRVTGPSSPACRSLRPRWVISGLPLLRRVFFCLRACGRPRLPRIFVVSWLTTCGPLVCMPTHRQRRYRRCRKACFRPVGLDFVRAWVLTRGTAFRFHVVIVVPPFRSDQHCLVAPTFALGTVHDSSSVQV